MLNSKLGVHLIKYLGSKRTMLPAISALIGASEARTSLDLFTGSTRVAVAMKQAGLRVTAVDQATYSEVLAKTFIEIDGSKSKQSELDDAVSSLESIKPVPGYFTEVFCEKARFFQPHNGGKIDAVRQTIENDYKQSWLYYPLLATLLIAADKVDSTTGVQMAYLKNWSRRSFSNLTLKAVQLIPGEGEAIRSDVLEAVKLLPAVDLAYLDPPYNQHRYFGNYHIWETLIRWDSPDFYGVANKRVDTRDDENRSAFNSKVSMPTSLRTVINELKTRILLISYNNESWLSRKDLIDMCGQFEAVEVVDFDAKRYVGSQIGGYNKSGELVGKPGAKRNLEHIVIAGSRQDVEKLRRAL